MAAGVIVDQAQQLLAHRAGDDGIEVDPAAAGHAKLQVGAAAAGVIALRAGSGIDINKPHLPIITKILTQIKIVRLIIHQHQLNIKNTHLNNTTKIPEQININITLLTIKPHHVTTLQKTNKIITKLITKLQHNLKHILTIILLKSQNKLILT